MKMIEYSCRKIRWNVFSYRQEILPFLLIPMLRSTLPGYIFFERQIISAHPCLYIRHKLYVILLVGVSMIHLKYINY